MKSTKEQLTNRGFLPDNMPNECEHYTNIHLMEMLKSDDAQKRSIAARVIGLKKDPALIETLCDALKTETALYTKIELQNSLAEFGALSVPHLIELLGCIGSNQHKKINNDDLGKKSYPLARDLAARVLCRIGPVALDKLRNVIKQGTNKQMLEAIDAIGHISFNFNTTESEADLVELYYSAKCDLLMKWKIVKALQAFNSDRVREILNSVVHGDNEIMKNEALRSLRRI